MLSGVRDRRAYARPAKKGMDGTAVELVERNLNVLRENSTVIDNIRSFWGDATNPGQFADDIFDVTLSLGPMCHLCVKKQP